jgi:hypothetical protein
MASEAYEEPRPMPRRSLLPFATALGIAALGACSSDDPAEGARLSSDEIRERLARERAEPLDVRGRSQLVTRLDQTLSQWHSAQFSARTSADRALALSLADVLHATVYKHFPDVLDLLLYGDDYQRTVCAAAIGFGRPVIEKGENIYQPAAASAEWKRATEPLIALLRHEDPRVVQNALLGLWRLRDIDAPLDPVLSLLLDSPVVDIRANAGLALTTMLTIDRGEQAIDVLLTATTDRSPRVRVQAISALVATRHPLAGGRLVKLLGDPYELVQANAARALGELGDPRHAGALVARLEQLAAETPSGKFRKPIDVDQRRQFLRAYLIEALQRLSGETYGDDPEDWRDWWTDRVESGAS